MNPKSRGTKCDNARPDPSFWYVLGLLVMAGCVTINPVTGQQQLALISDAQEARMGAQQMQQWVQANEGLFPEDGLQRYVSEVGNRIAQVSHRPGLSYEFAVINSPDLNAATLPGGKTLINRGLLAKLRTEDQLAALIAHEVGHSAAMHIATQVTNQSLTQLLLGGLQWGLSEGGVEGADYFLQGAGFGSQLALLKFSRDMERQADDLAIDYVMRAGYNPEAILQLMEILKQNERQGAALSFLQSHPLPEERLAAMATRLRSLPLETVQRAYRTREFDRATKRLAAVQDAFRWEESARAATKRRDFRNAIGDFKKAIKIFPDYAPFYAHLAFVQLKSGRFYEAQDTAREATRLAPDLFLTQSVAGLVHYAAKDFYESLNALRIADRIMPGMRPIRFYMAECHLALREKRQAIALYGSIAQESPQSPEGVASLARLKELGVVIS